MIGLRAFSKSRTLRMPLRDARMAANSAGSFTLNLARVFSKAWSRKTASAPPVSINSGTRTRVDFSSSLSANAASAFSSVLWSFVRKISPRSQSALISSVVCSLSKNPQGGQCSRTSAEPSRKNTVARLVELDRPDRHNFLAAAIPSYLERSPQLCWANLLFERIPHHPAGRPADCKVEIILSVA